MTSQMVLITKINHKIKNISENIGVMLLKRGANVTAVQHRPSKC